MSVHTHPLSPAIDDAIAAYALDALDASEIPALEQHLASCPACREQLLDLQRAVTGIGLSLDDAEPPAALRDRIVSAARATTPAAKPLPFTAARTAAPARPVTSTSTAFAWLAVAASLVLVGAMSWFVMMSRQQTADARNQRQAADARAASLQGELAALEARMTVISATDAHQVELQGQPDAPGSSARAFISASRGMVFTAKNLPPLATGRAYQLWIVTKQAPVSIGLLTVQADGSVTSLLPLSADASLNPVAVAVTVEPAGGVPSPTGPKVLVGLMSQH